MGSEFLKNNPEISLELSIQNASDEDVEGILTVQSQKIIIPELVKGAEKQELEENGFLVYPISAKEFKGIIEDNTNHIIHVAKEKDRVAGYIASYDMAKWEATHPDWFFRFDAAEEYKELLKKRKVLYGRHIAVDENISAVGKDLLDSTLQEAINRGYEYFIVEVLKEPLINKRSVKFCTKMGFKLVGQIEDKNNRIWSVFLKNLAEV